MGSFSESENKDRSGDELHRPENVSACCSIVPGPSFTSERNAHALLRDKEVAGFPRSYFFYSLSVRLLGRGNWILKRTIAVCGRVTHFGRMAAKED
jgi:hypothetical protein